VPLTCTPASAEPYRLLLPLGKQTLRTSVVDVQASPQRRKSVPLWDTG